MFDDYDRIDNQSVMFGLKFKEKPFLQKTERARVQEVLRLLRIGVPIMTVSEIASGG